MNPPRAWPIVLGIGLIAGAMSAAAQPHPPAPGPGPGPRVALGPPADVQAPPRSAATTSAPSPRVALGPPADVQAPLSSAATTSAPSPRVALGPPADVQAPPSSAATTSASGPRLGLVPPTQIQVQPSSTSTTSAPAPRVALAPRPDVQREPLSAASASGSRLALGPPIYVQPPPPSPASAPPPGDTAPSPTAKPLPPLVVIDPGHGGSNLGAPGLRDLHEKQLTLPLSRNLAARLEARGLRVLLTRDRDRFLTLRERVRLANDNSAAAFVSLHANASPTHTQQGFETWILSADAVDIDARALRTGDGAPRPGLDRSTALLLDDLERGAAQWEAAELAATIQEQLARVRGTAASRGVRQESKHVLLGATMPAVLVEVGFIDHPIEGRDLLEPAVQDAIADALANALAIQLGFPDATPRR